MGTFFFQIEAEPLPGNKQGKNVEGAYLQMIVIAGNIQEAEKRAFAIISDSGWAIS